MGPVRSAVSAQPGLVLPIGHSLGSAEDPVSGAAVQRVRVGPDVVHLTGSQFALWALAHGDPDRPLDQRWGEPAVLAAAERLGVGAAAGLLAELAADGLVARVQPGTATAVAFASAHQLKPLMLGLGNLAADPATYEVGLPGQPVAQVDAVLYRLYQWGHLEPDLWSACQVTAAGWEGELADPLRLLDAVLDAVHLLLGPNAAYLDIRP